MASKPLETNCFWNVPVYTFFEKDVWCYFKRPNRFSISHFHLVLFRNSTFLAKINIYRKLCWMFSNATAFSFPFGIITVQLSSCFIVHIICHSFLNCYSILFVGIACSVVRSGMNGIYKKQTWHNRSFYIKSVKIDLIY